MEPPFSTSKVTVEYFDPHDVYKLLAPGLIPRLPLRDLHWRSPTRPLRSIHTLHVELVPAGGGGGGGGTADASSLASPPPVPSPHASALGLPRSESGSVQDDGFQTASVAGGGSSSSRTGSAETVPAAAAASSSAAQRAPAPAPAPAPSRERRHQIPGLRRTPYLKLLLVRCDDNETYKARTRAEIREWIKTHATAGSSAKKSAAAHAENHDAFEWLIVHVVLPNTVAATQPRVTGAKGAADSSSDLTASKSSSSLSSASASRWRSSPSTLLEKLRSDFNTSGGKSSGSSSSNQPVDRVAQIRIGINDVPYDLLPRVVPAVPTGYSESDQDAENAWADLLAKVRGLILASFDRRVSQYEEDIREKAAQRALPGWNFCTFFLLKEGLARGFESVGLVEDALVGYDELSAGLDAVVQEQARAAGSAAAHGGALLRYSDELRRAARRALSRAAAAAGGSSVETTDEEEHEAVDLQAGEGGRDERIPSSEDIPIAAAKKPYRDLILSNNISVFDFRCYLFARQVALLLRLANAWASREELLARLRAQQESVLRGVAPRAVPPPPRAPGDEAEDLATLAEIGRRALAFIPAISQVLRREILAAAADDDDASASGRADGNGDGGEVRPSPALSEVVDNMVASFAFSVAQQILAQTATPSLPIPPTTLGGPPPPDDGRGHEPKAAIPEPKTMLHPARSSSLHVVRSTAPRPPTSPGMFSASVGGGAAGGGGGARRASVHDVDTVGASSQFLKAGLEELAARRAELYAVCRHILEERGKRRGWSGGWASAPVVGGEEEAVVHWDDVPLDDDTAPEAQGTTAPPPTAPPSTAGVDNALLRAALDGEADFYRLYEILTDKARLHYLVAGHAHAVQACTADLAVLHVHRRRYAAAVDCFYQATPSYGEAGWSLLELSMLVLYARCLRALGRRAELVKPLLKLLAKAAAAELDRLREQTSLRPRAAAAGSSQEGGGRPFPAKAALSGYLGELLETARDLGQEMRAPLAHFFCDVELDDVPAYEPGRDGYALTLRLRSLLVDELPVDAATLTLAPAASGRAAGRDVCLEAQALPVAIRPGENALVFRSTDATPGAYEATRILLRAGPLSLEFERGVGQATALDRRLTVLRRPRLVVHRRASCLDVRVAAARDVYLDRNNWLEVEVATGWNEVVACEVAIRSATGGLRLLMGEAEVRVRGESQPPAKTPGGGGGTFSFGAVPAGESVQIRFPFNVEQDLVAVALKIDVSYATAAHGRFRLCATPSVPIALALGVNVQDLFKHGALFSRFTVSTASASPLRLLGSELRGSGLFEARAGAPPSHAVTVFPRQPASLVYKITRRQAAGAATTAGAATGTATAGAATATAARTMYLKLRYSVLLDEIREAVRRRLRDWLQGTELGEYGPLAAAAVVAELQQRLGAHELETCALLDAVDTSVLAGAAWARWFAGLGAIGGVDAASRLSDAIASWRQAHPTVALSPRAADEERSILIPVDIPSVKMVNTVDIRIHNDGDGDGGGGSSLLLADPLDGAPAVCINQLLPATLHLKWTRLWDTEGGGEHDDLEFRYEVTAPADTWLVGGRRKGHFVIPAGAGPTSTPDTEADIPLLLIPLREGYLPYPNVEIREVRQGAAGEEEGAAAAAAAAAGHCETDHRNLGEVVRVVADRARVTLSLDASGPAGGPLVLERERLGLGGRVLA